jgi:AcrR family transcriptional regulator
MILTNADSVYSYKDMRKPKSERIPTQEALVEAAEQLFAEWGVEGTPLRRIAIAAGSANNFAVQYHFGTRDELVQAIFNYRLPELEARRAELLKKLDDPKDLRAVLEIICRPLFEQRDANGRHTHASFMSQLRHSPAGLLRHVIFAEKAPVTDIVLSRMRECLAHLSEREFLQRTSLALGIVLDATQGLDRGATGFEDEEETVQLVLTLIEAIMIAPQVKTVVAKFKREN